MLQLSINSNAWSMCLEMFQELMVWKICGQKHNPNYNHVLTNGKNVLVLATNSWSFCTYLKFKEATNPFKKTHFLQIDSEMFRCNIREGLLTYKLMGNYIGMMATENPKAVQDILRGVQQKCNGRKEDEIDVILKGTNEKDIQAQLKCMTDAISRAIRETDFEAIFEKTKRELMSVGERMKSCRTEQDTKEMAK